MNQEEQLKMYMQRVETLAHEYLKERKITALEALKEAINFIEGEMLER
jgi:hypothetical protein